MTSRFIMKLKLNDKMASEITFILQMNKKMIEFHLYMRDRAVW